MRTPHADVTEIPDPRYERWKQIWADLYDRELPRADHEAKRDEMWNWARERGEYDLCERARQASVSFRKPRSVADLAFIDNLGF